MTRSSFAVKTIGLGIFILGSLACGEAPPPKQPEVTPSTEADAAAAPPPAATETHADAGAAAAAAETPPPPPPAPAALALPSAVAKLKVKGKDVELKSDGTVISAGKPVAKISGMELQDPTGKTQLKVDSDGNVATADGGAYAKFEGDELASGTTKWSVGDDGALNSTDDKGKKTPLGKGEGVGSAKKSALVAAAFVVWGTKSPGAGKAAAPAKPAAGEKTAAEKPAAGEKKPAEKPAGKK